ncbi:MAG: FeoB-associated Cys-rich membrane protein, partial [Bulleidia sp.]
MNAADWIILVIVLAAVIAALRSVKKNKGSCSCGCGSADSPEPIRVHDRNPNHYSHEALIRIDGMHCTNCAVKVDNALNQIEG